MPCDLFRMEKKERRLLKRVKIIENIVVAKRADSDEMGEREREWKQLYEKTGFHRFARIIVLYFDSNQWICHWAIDLMRRMIRMKMMRAGRMGRWDEARAAENEKKNAKCTRTHPNAVGHIIIMIRVKSVEIASNKNVKKHLVRQSLFFLVVFLFDHYGRFYACVSEQKSFGTFELLQIDLYNVGKMPELSYNNALK